ncbi:P-loop containing nucleoside triphosphate hydrolase protein [Halteromyces radiatus]|uniref:P-loop containing nucleoside triphosphate hydrolase protein n=1 Tax=Halteromyces radiatus TaxID=101107 RepID=UPI00221EC7AE|nr:P-loop containing nucleoside triphosphate hydrolase protein [Halteromyces radiatus]KAI8079931.1 P-loop containing nucleoside triphosphate hydrolase protein [Halteromyces radiatus]
MAFWKPGTIAPGSSVDRDTENETDTTVIAHAEQQYRHLTLKQQRERLPVFKLRRELLYSIETYQTTIVIGQTGCGKTTQIPQYLEEAGWTRNRKQIACTQPRRIAATTVAQRVADEKSVKLGDEVGYLIRFDDQTSSKTRIKYMTDGMLFRETMIDPLLTNYDVVMIDEAHERSLYTDILLGVLKKIQKKRPDLHVIISSATLDAETFYTFFNHNTTKDRSKDTANIISLEGRMYPVDTLYVDEPVPDYVEKTIQTVFDIHTQEARGDILIFLTGREEIDHVVSEIYDRAKTLPKGSLYLEPLPLYAGLTLQEQLRVFEPTPRDSRKVIVSTNIAEASVTLEGIVYVIDCGFVKIRAYNPKTGMEALVVTPISKASALQRAGRAGRVRPGKAFRLYTEETYNTLRDTSIPEIQRTNLAPVILQLKALGIDNVLRFDFVTAPPAALMIRALELLYSLKALDDVGRLTLPLGMTLAEFPVDPMLGKILLSSGDFHCSQEIVTIAAMVSVQNIFIQPSRKMDKMAVLDIRRQFWVEEGDHLSLLNVYNGFIHNGKSGKWCHDRLLNFKALARAIRIRQQLVKYLKRFKVPMVSAMDSTSLDQDQQRQIASERIRKCLVSGYFSQAARAEPDGSGRFRTIRDGVLLNIHPDSVLFNRNPSCVLFHEVVETNKAYMRDLTAIDEAWLAELAPHFYQYANTKK